MQQDESEQGRHNPLSRPEIPLITYFFFYYFAGVLSIVELQRVKTGCAGAFMCDHLPIQHKGNPTSMSLLQLL